MKKVLVMGLLLAFTQPAFAHTGGPKRLNCELTARVYKEDIKEMMDINDLLAGSETIQLGEATQECDAFNGEVQTCVVELAAKGIELRYYFNTQNGGLEMEDTNNGQSTYTDWLNQYEETKSGYLHLRAELTNRRGGLSGSSRVFQVEGNCWAGKDDWK